MAQNVFKCKKTDKAVGVMVDGFIFATADFCPQDNFTNNSIITVTEEDLQERLEELS